MDIAASLIFVLALFALPVLLILALVLKARRPTLMKAVRAVLGVGVIALVGIIALRDKGEPVADGGVPPQDDPPASAHEPAAAEPPAPPQSEAPDRFADLCGVIEGARTAAEAAEGNEIRVSQDLTWRRDTLPSAMRAAVPDGLVVGWHAELDSLSVAEDGTVSLVLSPGCRIDLLVRAEIAIPAGDPLVNILAGFEEGDDLTVSGAFLPPLERNADTAMGFHEISVSEAGALRNPEFRFLLVAVAAEGEDPVGGDEAAVRAALEARETQVAAEATACREDLQCWGDKHHSMASMLCPPVIESLARYDFEWTDGLLESKLDRFGWAEKSKGWLRYTGSRIKIQNGFGAWTPLRYECIFDPENGVVLDVRAAGN